MGHQVGAHRRGPLRANVHGLAGRCKGQQLRGDHGWGLPEYEEKVWPKGEQKMEAALRRTEDASHAPFQETGGIFPVPRRHYGLGGVKGCCSVVKGCAHGPALNGGHRDRHFALSRARQPFFVVSGLCLLPKPPLKPNLTGLGFRTCAPCALTTLVDWQYVQNVSAWLEGRAVGR